MPVWLQMTAVLSSAVLSGVMGIALIPFLKKYHFCDPDTNSEKQNSETISESKVKPTMCGILLIFGCVAGFVLSDTLYLQFCGADRTSTEFQAESFHIRITMIHCLVFGILGWLIDYQRTNRKKFYLEELDSIVNLLVFFLN